VPDTNPPESTGKTSLDTQFAKIHITATAVMNGLMFLHTAATLHTQTGAGREAALADPIGEPVAVQQHAHGWITCLVARSGMLFVGIGNTDNRHLVRALEAVISAADQPEDLLSSRPGLEPDYLWISLD
jgi:hypothetical protein